MKILKLFTAIYLKREVWPLGEAFMPPWSLEVVINFLFCPLYEHLYRASTWWNTKSCFCVFLATGLRIFDPFGMVQSSDFLPNYEIKFWWFDRFKARWNLLEHFSPRLILELLQFHLTTIIFTPYADPLIESEWEDGMWPLVNVTILLGSQHCIWVVQVGSRKLACSHSSMFFSRPWSVFCDLVGT